MILASAEGIAAITAGATLAGAGGLAFVTIHTTNRRLGEERERQKRALEAEAERQAAALSHDRELADIADLRVLLDAAAGAMDELGAAQRNAYMAICMTLDSNREARMNEAEKELQDAGSELIRLRARLRVRLGPDDPIAVAMEDARMSLSDVTILFFQARWSGAPPMSLPRSNLRRSLRALKPPAALSTPGRSSKPEPSNGGESSLRSCDGLPRQVSCHRGTVWTEPAGSTE